MSQVENSRPRTGQIIRPASFGGQPGQPGQRDAPVDPAYGIPGPPYGQGGCERQMCGCGTAYCGPGQDFCWWCMKQMLVKEMACLLKTDPELQAILNAPKMGVTDAAPQIPGQIGEWIIGQAPVNIPALTAGQGYNTSIGVLVVPPGEWLLTSMGYPTTANAIWEGVGLAVEPVPPGLTNDMAANLYSPGGEETILNGVPAQGSFTGPTLLPFNCWFAGAPGGSIASGFMLVAQGWRMR